MGKRSHKSCSMFNVVQKPFVTTTGKTRCLADKMGFLNLVSQAPIPIHPLLDRSDNVIRNHRPALCGKLQANRLLRRVSHLLSHFGRLCHEPGRVKSSYTTEGHSSE